MKKIILSIALFFVTNLLFSSRSFAQCETILPDQLQSCFNSLSPGALTVTVIGSNLYITGIIDPSFRDQAQACVDEYIADALSCPNAPVIVYDNPPAPGYPNGNSINPNLTQPNTDFIKY